MKTRAKVGNRGKGPAFRTPSSFRFKKCLEVAKTKTGPAAKNFGTNKYQA